MSRVEVFEILCEFQRLLTMPLADGGEKRLNC